MVSCGHLQDKTTQNSSAEEPGDLGNRGYYLNGTYWHGKLL